MRLLHRCCLFFVFLLTFSCSQSKSIAQVQAVGHRIYVDGKPFLIAADTGWAILNRISYEEADNYLNVRQTQGFNTILADIIPGRYERNYYGNSPFIDRDLTRPNEAYWQHVDRLVQNMARRGLLVMFKTATLCCDWGKGNELNPTSARAYGQFLGKRYGKYNIVWIHCGDRNPDDKQAATIALIEGIRAVAPQQLHSCHPQAPNSAADILPQGFVNLNLTYTYRPEKTDAGLPQYHVYSKSRQDFERSPVLPFFLGESQYESPYGDIPTQMVRRQAYWSILSGSTGHAYGHYLSCINVSVLQDVLRSRGDRPNFKNVLHLRWQDILTAKGAEDMRHVRSVFTSRNWVDLVPDRAQRWVVGGYGTHNTSTRPGGDDYVTAAYTSDARLLMAYIPTGKAIAVDLRRFPGEVDVKWFDPTNGSYSSVGKFSNRNVRQFTVPGANEDGDRDWVFIASSQPRS